MTFAAWLDTFVAEKGIDLEAIMTVPGPSGDNFIPVSALLAAMKAAPSHEQAGIKSMVVKIDFRNGDVLHYFRHLAQAIAI